MNDSPAFASGITSEIISPIILPVSSSPISFTAEFGSGQLLSNNSDEENTYTTFKDVVINLLKNDDKINLIILLKEMDSNQRYDIANLLLELWREIY